MSTLSSSSFPDARQAAHCSDFDITQDIQHHLQTLDISCHHFESPHVANSVQTDAKAELKLLQLEATHLKTQLLAGIKHREDNGVTFRQAAEYAAAKGSANGVLHALFDQASAGKTTVLTDYLETGSIPTRDGLKHWKLDLCTIRNDVGATLLHVAVGVSTARQNVKVKLVHLLVDSVGFDPNVQNAFGQTPLHIAAMGGYSEVIQALLERGANPIAQDRSGLTALSLIRTLSRPPEEVVHILVDAESAALRSIRSRSESISLSKALASALFLRRLSQFTLPNQSDAFAWQTAALVNKLLEGEQEGDVDFDTLLQEQVPVLFHAAPSCQVVRLSTIFASSLYSDADFIDDLRLEADSYELSLVLPAVNSAALAGPTWIFVLSKLVQRFKVEIVGAALTDSQTANDDLADSVISCMPYDDEVTMKASSNQKLLTPSLRNLSTCSLSSSYSVDPRFALYYADQVTATAKSRDVWYYALLFKASTSSFPGTLSVTPESDVAVSSEDVSKYFPLEDRLLIGSAEYFATEYNPETREIRLDRMYDGKEAVVVKAYLTGACSSQRPPYVALKRIWERQPGNKYEDQMSSEQVCAHAVLIGNLQTQNHLDIETKELFQDYQFLDPDSEYEVAMKLGPISTKKDAQEIVTEWKQAAKQLFDSRECNSNLACCKYYCQQRKGHSLLLIAKIVARAYNQCLGSLAVIGQGLAKRRLGRPTYFKSLQPRASLQRLQNRFKGTQDWPGSASSVTPVVLASRPS